jgi:hypothetical protein
MSNYNPQAKLYYVKYGESPSESNRIVPAPEISISHEYIYANDVAIGYTYIVTLNGYATSLDLRNPNISDTLGLKETIDAIKTIKNLFSHNNGYLQVDSGNNGLIFKATGSMIKSLNFEQSDNQWVNYAPYSVEIEFNELQIGDCNGAGTPVNCGELPPNMIQTPLFLDMKEHKVKSFSDSWSFDAGDTIYNSYDNFKNEHFNVTYNIDVTGKHYFNGSGGVLPAWEQAKNFAQKRLYDQVKTLVTGVLPSQSGTVCDIALNYDAVFGSEGTGILSELNDYKVYNEKISCQTSEFAGSFRATYTAILKRSLSDDTYSDENSIHTFSLVKDFQDDGRTKKITANLQGNIQGLIPGGLISTSSIIEFPENGNLIIPKSSETSNNKYSNALIAYNKIGDKKSIKEDFANLIGITNGYLLASGLCIDPSGTPLPSSHTVTHNYLEGTISYSTSYDSDRACQPSGTTVRNITYDIQNPTPIIQEFVIPGRASGPIIQDIGATTVGKIIITYEGFESLVKCCPDLSTAISQNCINDTVISGVPAPPDIDEYVWISDKPNLSSDGSFTVVRTYIKCETN